MKLNTIANYETTADATAYKQAIAARVEHGRDAVLSVSAPSTAPALKLETAAA